MIGKLLAALLLLPAPAILADDPYDVLVFSRTAGFRHDAIPAGIQTVRELGAANGFSITATEDPATFSTAGLAGYEAVVFLNTTGDVLNAAQQTAFESYIRAGGGYVGVHAAADTEYDWPFYGELVGAYFASHPAIQSATVAVEDRAHAATAHLPQRWNRTDEWYNYRTNPRSTAHVLATLDESSYWGGGMGADHPHVWCKTYEGGRSFYTGGGHTKESYADPAFRAHLLGGIRYAAEATNADCRPETGYTALYNGSTTGWSQAGPGAFTNTDATLTSTGGLGLLWYSQQQFTDYSLKLDWKLAGDDNSGVFIGFPPSTDPWSAVNNGYEVQIDATDAADRTTGSVYSFQSADLAARDAALNPPGEWNTYELLVEGEHLQVFLNGTKINDFTNTDPVRSLAGHIGLQNHGDGDDASFRNIRIKNLDGTQPPGPVTGPIVGLANKCLDVAGSSTFDGTKVQLYTCNAPTPSSGPRPRTARARSRPWASAWTCPRAAPPTAPGCSSGPATARARRTGPRGRTRPCATRSRAGASTSARTTRPTASRSSSGTAWAPPIRSGLCLVAEDRVGSGVSVTEPFAARCSYPCGPCFVGHDLCQPGPAIDQPGPVVGRMAVVAVLAVVADRT